MKTRSLIAPLVICLWAPAARAAVTLPPAFTLPPGYTLVENQSRNYDYDHQPMGYFKPKSSAMEHIDPSGRTWRIYLKVTPTNKTGDATDATMRAAVKEQGWEVLTPSGALVARRTLDGKEQWLHGTATSGNFGFEVVEPGPPPHPLTLAAPAATPEKFGDKDDFPYLGTFPGATLVKTEMAASGSFIASPPGAKEQLHAGPPIVSKFYKQPANASPYEYMVAYRDGLTKAGWTIIDARSGGDALVVAHYARGGRDIYAYLHGDRVNVADVGAQNEAKQLAEALARQGHVAIYGIYFDIDKATLKGESETALMHVLALLDGDKTLKLEVQGHTDNTGAADHNQKLSEERAASVKKWLLDHGVAAARLTPKGYGATKPVADNNQPEGRSTNRRVELAKI